MGTNQTKQAYSEMESATFTSNFKLKLHCVNVFSGVAENQGCQTKMVSGFKNGIGPKITTNYNKLLTFKIIDCFTL